MRCFQILTVAGSLGLLGIGTALHADVAAQHDAVFVKAFSNGTQVGWRVTGLVTDSPMVRLGFKEDDIILSYKKRTVVGDSKLLFEMNYEIEEGTCGPIAIKRGNSSVVLTCKK